MTKYACCFCGDTINADKYGVTSLFVMTHWDKDIPDQQDQQFFCHLTCLKKSLHKKTPFYLADIKDDSERLHFLLEQYLSDKINTNTFCDHFTDTYGLETESESLSALEQKLFRSLYEFTGRFSPYEEDLKLPNVYYNEQEIRDKATETAKLLGIVISH
jgi:hypothetical protein